MTRHEDMRVGQMYRTKDGRVFLITRKLYNRFTKNGVVEALVVFAPPPNISPKALDKLRRIRPHLAMQQPRRYFPCEGYPQQSGHTRASGLLNN
jgi:hypothetical protein